LRKKALYPLVFFAGISIILFLLSQPILNWAGDLLAPMHNGKTEVVILEGTETIENGAALEGIRLLRTSRAKCLVIVLHISGKDGQLFAIQEEYPNLLKKKLKKLGLTENQLKILLIPIDDSPITLTEAKFVVEILAKEGLHEAILLSEGFHSRRSWAVYRQEGRRYNISVKSYPFFIHYRKENWWHQKEGIRDFVQEFTKLIYYLGCRYISIGSVLSPQ
jgi:uncharacterized SAM-binding protein YcdF (DUF218 family)